jgi:hypothetical protein
VRSRASASHHVIVVNIASVCAYSALLSHLACRSKRRKLASWRTGRCADRNIALQRSARREPEAEAKCLLLFGRSLGGGGSNRL